MRLFEVENTELPDDVVKAFTNLASQQRGAPEKAMLKVQQLMGGGVLNPVVEHTGDLTHRMTEMAQYGKFGHEFVKEKTERILKHLERDYGFEREFKENIQNNAKYWEMEPEDLKKKIDEILNVYAREHSKLPVYNKLQWLAREAAVAVGEQNFSRAANYVRTIDNIANNKEKYREAAMEFNKDEQGNLVQYSPR